MKRFLLKTAPQGHETDVRIKAGVLLEIAAALPANLASQVVIITDSNVGLHYGEVLLAAFRSAGWEAMRYTFDAGEPAKSLQTAQQVYAFLAKARFFRDGLIVALGGGVVGDVAGFVAGTWMRGVPWMNCPTTMEADVDACIGGKTAVNLADGKNLVGVFHHPMIVAVDPNCLSTLPERDVRAGLAEAIKHALLQSTQEVEWLEANASRILALDPEITTELIERNLRFKARIVTEDPHERSDVRILLNFGHTIGHGIEACAEGALRHGECVSLGMLAACWISHRAGLLGDEEIERIRNLLVMFCLPTKLELALDRERVLETLPLDKKNTGRRSRFVLLNGIGTPVIREDIPAEWIAVAYESLVAN